MRTFCIIRHAHIIVVNAKSCCFDPESSFYLWCHHAKIFMFRSNKGSIVVQQRVGSTPNNKSPVRMRQCYKLPIFNLKIYLDVDYRAYIEIWKPY